MILFRPLSRFLLFPLVLILIIVVFVIANATAQLADRIAMDGWGSADGSLIAHYRSQDEETAATCRTESCTFQTIAVKFEPLVPQASVNAEAILEDPGSPNIPDPPERNIRMSISAQMDPVNAVQMDERSRQMELATAEHAQWLSAMLAHYTPNLIVNSAELGALKSGDRAVVLFNPATRTQLHANIPWEHNGYNYLFGWIQSIEALREDAQRSRIRLTVDQTPSSNGWVGIRRGGLWAKTRRDVIEEDKSNTDTVFPMQVGLIAWPQASSSAPMRDIDQLHELGRAVVAAAPSAALDPRCKDSQAADAGCVWVLSNTSIIPLQVSIRKRVGDTVYIDERTAFLKRSIAAKDWRELSARQRRSPPSLGANVKLVMPKLSAMTSGMTARSSTP